MSEVASGLLFSARQWRIRAWIIRQQLAEFALFDSRLARLLVGITGCIAGFILMVVGNRIAGMELLARVHRGDYSKWLSGRITRLFSNALQGSGGWMARRIGKALRDFPYVIASTKHTARFFEDPSRLLDGSAIVLKSPSQNEKGVLYIYYSYLYPLFIRFYDWEEVESRYYIVVEPSWSGYCDANILSLALYRNPVFVGSIEPRDSKFLSDVSSRLLPVYFGGNTWIDPNLFCRLDDIEKEFDLIYIATWSAYKRHWALFRALSRIRRRGRVLRVALIGFPVELTARDIHDQAAVHGVADWLTFFENIPPAAVNELLNRSKLNIMWSRREGVNRAIIEAMAAGTPCLIREGFNYGYHYPYVNARSGRFVSEHELPGAILQLLDSAPEMNPREAVVPRMTPEASTARLNEALQDHVVGTGEAWTRDIVQRAGSMHGLGYRTPEERLRFQGDYDWLRARIKVSGQAVQSGS